MNEASKKIIEFETGTTVVQVNKAAFEEYMDPVEIDIEKTEVVYHTNFYNTDGKYVGSYTGSYFAPKDDNTKYYIPKER